LKKAGDAQGLAASAAAQQPTFQSPAAARLRERERLRRPRGLALRLSGRRLHGHT